jgi:hypothetical protein
MKKLLLSTALLTSMAVIPVAASTRTSTATALESPQIRLQIGRNRRFRRVRVVTTTRIVGFGRNRYRETIRTTYHPNGLVTTRVISREQIGWGRG